VFFVSLLLLPFVLEKRDRQHNGQKVKREEGQTTQWPKGKGRRGTNNTIAKR
jgi:hypothetical protein